MTAAAGRSHRALMGPALHGAGRMTAVQPSPLAVDTLDHNDVELLSRRFDPKPWPAQDRSSWLTIRPTTITGRTLHASDNEWAFPPEAYL